MTGDERQLLSSNRERRLWLWALAVVVAIYATADLVRTVADALRESGLLELTPTMFSAGMFLIGVMILVQGLRERSRGVEVGFALGVAAIAVIGLARGIDAAERSHLIEYAVLALIIHEALVERKVRGWRVPVPAVLAISATTAVGVVDECIQFFVPSRTFDWFDIGFDLLASVLAVGSSVSIRWVRRGIGRWRSRS
ncbi:VanZ family protein [Candidatus Palauibacter sp.]|uniref:VanZ family protein n=1 Tax=Candidatus Palauibacter sp. TaxID=3101350 RepID=UPI003B59DEB9